MRGIREARGYSQERLAELARLHRTYVGGIERGERNVSLINIWRLAEALDVNPAAFFEIDIKAQHLRSEKATKIGKI